MKHNGVQYLHTLMFVTCLSPSSLMKNTDLCDLMSSECIRLAFADVRAYVADPEMAKVPVQELLSKVSTLRLGLIKTFLTRICLLTTSAIPQIAFPPLQPSESNSQPPQGNSLRFLRHRPLHHLRFRGKRLFLHSIELRWIRNSCRSRRMWIHTSEPRM